MNKIIVVGLMAAAVVGVATTQLTLFTIGGPSSGSTHLLTRTGMASNYPFFASDEQQCAGAGPSSTAISMCERAASAFVPGGPHHLLALPYMGFVRSLSVSFSSDI